MKGTVEQKKGKILINNYTPLPYFHYIACIKKSLHYRTIKYRNIHPSKSKIFLFSIINIEGISKLKMVMDLGGTS